MEFVSSVNQKLCESVGMKQASLLWRCGDETSQSIVARHALSLRSDTINAIRLDESN